MNIVYLAQKAFRTLLDGAGITTIPAGQHYKGIEQPRATDSLTGVDTRRIPCTISQCSDMDVVDPTSGNWEGSARVEIHSNAFDTTDEQHQERASEVMTALLVDDLAAQLSALDGFTAFLAQPTGTGYEIRGNRWVSFVEFNLICAPSNVT